MTSNSISPGSDVVFILSLRAFLPSVMAETGPFAVGA